MYEDPATCFSTNKFWSFNNLLDCSHKQIHIKWFYDLNEGNAILSFVCHSEQIYAKHKLAPVDKDVWTDLVAQVKLECTCKISIALAFLCGIPMLCFALLNSHAFLC